jgi:hypothetical protein
LLVERIAEQAFGEARDVPREERPLGRCEVAVEGSVSGQLFDVSIRGARMRQIS